MNGFAVAVEIGTKRGATEGKIMSKNLSLLVGLFALGFVMLVGAAPAWADDCSDVPDPWNETDCDWEGGTVCEYDAGTIVCTGSGARDVIFIFSSNDDPIAYGIVAIGWPTSEYFCCDATELDDDTHPLDIDLGAGNDNLCMHDTSHAWCNNAMGGDPWPAAAEIKGGIGDDNIDTSLGAVASYVDVINGGSGDDVIYGNAGNDEITGAGGDDTIYGNAGNDDIWAGDGEDTVYGGDGEDQIDGGKDPDSLYGGGHADDICGGEGGLTGNHGTLDGQGGDDCICGGDDYAPGNNDDGGGYDDMTGSTGTDTCYYFGIPDTYACETETEDDDCGCDCP